MDNTVKGLQKPNTASSVYNAMDFIIKRAISEKVNTAIICKVVNRSGQYVDVLPLVTPVNGFGETVEPTTLFHLPYMRYQAGTAGIILDPVAGDIGLAVFAQKDCSNVVQGTTEPQQPGSFRGNSMANGFYVGGFLNQNPTTIIELKQDGSIFINATGNVTVKGDVIADGISLKNHTHGGVESGGSDTGKPK